MAKNTRLLSTEQIKAANQLVARRKTTRSSAKQVKRSGSAWGKSWTGISLRIHPDQVAEFNEAAQAAGTGAYYDEKGNMKADSEAAMQREMGRRGWYDKEAGFRDESRRLYEQYEAETLAHEQELLKDMPY